MVNNKCSSCGAENVIIRTITGSPLCDSCIEALARYRNGPRQEPKPANKAKIERKVVPGKFYCNVCDEYLDKPEKVYQGHLALEIILWILLFPIGLIYTIWRQVSKKEICPYCKSPGFIPGHIQAKKENRTKAD